MKDGGSGMDKFSHGSNTFIVCLDPEPKEIVRHVFDLLRPAGVLGLAVWGLSKIV